MDISRRTRKAPAPYPNGAARVSTSRFWILGHTHLHHIDVILTVVMTRENGYGVGVFWVQLFCSTSMLLLLYGYCHDKDGARSMNRLLDLTGCLWPGHTQDLTDNPSYRRNSLIFGCLHNRRHLHQQNSIFRYSEHADARVIMQRVLICLTPPYSVPIYIFLD